MSVWFALPLGMLASFGVIALMQPALPAFWRWRSAGILMHAGVFLIGQGLLCLLLGRPWFATSLALAFLMLLVLVSNAKQHALREPFVFQDFEYFTDAIRHPRLYIPFLGWGKFITISLVVIVVLSIGLWLEPMLPGIFVVGALQMLAGGGLIAISAGAIRSEFQPVQDMQHYGLIACLWAYASAERRPLCLRDSFSGMAPLVSGDLVVVQSESFFDPRNLFAGIRPEVLATYDQIRDEAMLAGRLNVPAWGANTVRSEFSFLSGSSNEALGVHRFNPYRRLSSGSVSTFVHALRRAGYRTVCVHPYQSSFYRRDHVFPLMGFDEFIDIAAFAEAPRSGPFVADLALVGKVRELLDTSAQPLFVFVITMENHGPLHLEKLAPGDVDALYREAPPRGCDDLTIYLRHLRNADRMIGELRNCLLARSRPAVLCWYGDHVPIMPAVYRQFGEPTSRTEYLIWCNRPSATGERRDLPINQLAAHLLAR